MYGGVEAAPDMTSFGGAPSDIMPLGPDPSMIGLPSGAPPSVAQHITVNIHDSVVQGDVGSAVADSATNIGEHPPVPEAGLPPGWTMEQWQHYGAEWLRQQG